MNHPPLPSRPLHGARRQPEEGLGARPATPPPESAAAAREHVRELLLLAGIGLDSVPAADALLVTSELVTNAIRHGHGVTAFRADIADGVLRLSIADANPLPPTARTGSAEHPGGYGWPLVQRLAERVDCTIRADGKTITTALRLS
ncbi:ATP-binding protein [Streptomyces polychromogenes]|nr:ATP-binding protein [Streptomyces polychromogenes]